MELIKVSLLLTFAFIIGSNGIPNSKPTTWEIFNVTDPGPEYWLAQERKNSNRSMLWERYLHNDIEPPTEEMRQGMKGEEWRWPNGMIPVWIDPNWNWNAKNNIVKGLQYLQGNTCIRFENYNRQNPAHSRFVKVEPAGQNYGCRALAGRYNMPEGQWVRLEPNEHCLSPGTVAHEFIHTIGYWHEHQRPDRDDWVTINYQNIPQQRWMDFERKDDLGIFGTPYDYNSIMHYMANAVAINPNQPTIISKTSTPVQGQEEYLTQYDIQKINNMYRGICQ